MRFLFYSHDGLGLGHTRRNLAIATALTELAPQASVLLATGADYVARLGVPSQVDILKLPGLRKIANGEYCARHLNLPVPEIRELRSELLTTAVKAFFPSVVLVDKHPFGASGEFRAGLEELRKQGGRAALGLRDILDEPEYVLDEWRPMRMQHRIAAYYDEVFIYGQRSIFDSTTAYDFPPSLAERTRFCGYVENEETPADLADVKLPFPAREDRVRPVVLATTGGGEDGFAVLASFIRAAAGATWQGVVISGPMTPEPEAAAIKRLADEHNVIVRKFIPHLSALFWSVDALVCMGGYNTLCEAVSKGLPTVCVPRIVPRTEQLIRAQAFRNLGLLRAIRPDQLNVTNLRAEIGHALKQSRQELLTRAQKQLSFDGARQAARRLLALANDRSETAFDARQDCSSPMLEGVGAAGKILASPSRPQ
jgi:predicted glycosyltransferase